MQREEITLEQKRRYLKEIDSIHALSKKVLPPRGKTWSEIADARFRKVMNMPVKLQVDDPIVVENGLRHDQHSPRSARLIERTLKSGLYHPDILHHYYTGAVKPQKKGELLFVPRSYPRKRSEPAPVVEPLRHDDLRVQNVIQHNFDIEYPSGHMQGEGFVPRMHTFNSHVPIQTPSFQPARR